MTCAAFSPADGRVAVRGGGHLRRHGSTCGCRPGGEADRKAYHRGKVTKVDATDPRYVTVRVEIDNRECSSSSTGAQATVIINPA